MNTKLPMILLLCLISAGVFAEDTLTGAGASFPYPVYSGWAWSYEKETGIRVNYQSVGSGGGIRQITAGTVDFGASDDPLTQEELDKAGLIQFPAIAGGIVIAVNLDGNRHNRLVLDGETVAAIFLGRITRWNDPEIAAFNPGLTLPDASITVIRRSDSSGTTAVFTEYLCKVSREWNHSVGRGKSVNWKAGIGAKGNDGVANMIRQTRNSIGYTEFTYAEQAKLNYINLLNRLGTPVSPSVSSFSAAADSADWHRNPSYAISLTCSSDPQSWPITAVSFILIRKDDPEKQKKVMKFFSYGFKNGDTAAVYLKYVPLPGFLKEEILSLYGSAE